MKSILKLLLLMNLLVIGACTTGPQRPHQVHGDDNAYTREYMRWMIGEQMAKNDIPGLSIVLVDDQKIAWAEGFGYADRSNKLEATADTIYRLGSITKLFTATAAMQLAEQGRLDIDQPLQSYLPEFAIKSRYGDNAAITPRTLMTHHSGLPSDRINGMWGDPTADFTGLAAALQDEYVAYPPNTILSYSNLGFSLLGHLVETLSGMPYADYIEQNILWPTGMKHAYISSNLRDDGASAKGYYNNREYKTPHLRDVPAGALNASVIDMAHFAQMMFADGSSNGVEILKPETIAQMQSFQDGDAIFDMSPSVGLGWFLDDSLGDTAGVTARHNGGTSMFVSEFLTLPKHKLAVVVLANSNSAGRAVGKIAEKTLALALESKTGIRIKQPLYLKQTLPTLAEDLERFPGAWSIPSGLAQVKRKDFGLEAELHGETLELLRKEDGYFHPQYKILGLLPVALGELEKAGIAYRRIGGREVAIVAIDGRPRGVIAEKASVLPLPDPWKIHLGRYQSINSKGDMQLKQARLVYQQGLLLIKLEWIVMPAADEDRLTLVLQTINDNEAVVHGLGRGKGDTLHFIELDGEQLLSYSGFLLRRVD